jgi:N-acylneuraminate cytidylyltransferase/CMP-N,N'-diacetyllegionaminic acid synthase
MAELRILGLVPARGGSKGLPGKNVLPLGGKPMIAWTVAAALQSGVCEDVVVSTDDLAIAQAGREEGAQILVRPDVLARDDTSMIDVVLHALDAQAEAGRDYTHVMLLQPTSPLRESNDLQAAVERLTEAEGRAVVSVCPVQHSPLLTNTLPPDGSMSDFLAPHIVGANRQDLPRYYRLNGAIYLADVAFLRSNRSFIGPGTFALVMPRTRSVDVDDELDFALARCLIEWKQE